MVIRINPHQQAIWRDPHTLQIGLGKNQPVFRRLSPAQEKLIAALYRGIADQHFDSFSSQLGVSGSESKALLRELDSVLEKQIEPTGKIQPLASEYVESAFAEIVRASLQTGFNGEQVLIERGLRKISIDHLGGAGLSLALGLASAGIGQIYSADSSKVMPEDLGPTGYPTQLLGHSKINALNLLLAASPNQARIHAMPLKEHQLDQIECAVLVGHQVVAPVLYSTWMNRDVPHLAITAGAESVSVSPIILPGQTPCLLCLEQSRATADPSWPAVASQLVGRKHRFDDSTAQFFAAGLALQKILQLIDTVSGFGQVGENRVGYELNRSSGELVEISWPVSPKCSCQSPSGLE